MAEPKNDGIVDFLRSAGFSASGIDRIKLGTGVVGKITSIQMGLYVVLFAGIIAGVILKNHPIVIGSVIAGVATYALSIFVSIWFADRNPAAAILEGAELVQYRKIEMGAKGLAIPAEQVSTTPPTYLPAEEKGDK